MKVNVDLAQTEVMETQSAVTHTHTYTSKAESNETLNSVSTQ